jgi:GDP-4-dehydro-6-deoxy-D-mannose reductase
MMGSHLLETVLADGDEALGTYYKPTIDLDHLEGLPLQEVDVTDWCSVFDSLSAFRPDLIFHLAAQSYPVVSLQRPIETITTNVVGTITVFEALRRLKLDARVIVACSSAEYGVTVAADKPLTEDTPLLPLHPYGVSKVAQDLLAYQYHQSFGLDTVRARIFNCTGTRKVGDALSDFVRRVVWLERHPEETAMRVGNLKTRRAIVDVRDLNAALLALARQGKSGEAYNVSGDTAYLMGSVVERVLAQSVRRDLEVVADPALFRPTDEPVIWGDTSRLKAATGWRQRIPLDDTIADMLAFWRWRLPRNPEGSGHAGPAAELVATTVGGPTR